MGVKKYHRILFLGAILLELAAMAAYLCACFFIALQVAQANVNGSYLSQMETYDYQSEARMEAAQEFVRIASEQSAMQRSCERYLSQTPGADLYPLMSDLYTLLNRFLYSHPQFETAFLLTRESAVTPSRIFRYAAVAQPGMMSQIGFCSAAADVHSLMDEGSAGVLQPHNVCYALVSQEAALVAVLRDEEIFAWDGAENVCVVDRFGRTLYAAGAVPARATQVEHTNPQSGVRFICYQDRRELAERVWGYLYGPALLLGLIVLGTIGLMVPLTRWVMKPFALLRDALRAYPARGRTFPVLLDRLRTTRGFRWRVFLMYSLGIVPMLATIPTFMGSMERCVMETMTAAYAGTVAQRADSLAEDLQLVREFTNTMVYDDDMRALLKEDASASFSERLVRARAFQMGISEAGLYSAAGELLCGTSPGVAASLTRAQRALFQRNYAFSSFYAEKTDPASFAVLCAIRAVDEGEPEAFFSVLGYLDLHIASLLSRAIGPQGSSTYFLYEKEGWSLIGTPAYLENRPLVEGMCQAGLLETDRPGFRRVTLAPAPGEKSAEPEEILLFSAPVRGSGYTLVATLPVAPIRAYAQQLPLYVELFVCLFVLSILFFSALLSRRVTGVSRAVEEYFYSSSPGAHPLPPRLRKENEVSALAHAFGETLDRVAQLNDTLLREQKRQAEIENRRRQAEVIALQSQMDSHLISNIFASMKLLFAQGEYRPLGEMIEATGDFLRSGLVHDEYDVPLQREIDHVNAYVAIQTIRFGERIEVRLRETDEGLRAALVPKYLLQPLIENAVSHGMRPHSTLHVEICVERSGEEMLVSVRDDGKGTEESAVEALNERLRAGIASDHIGLINVAERVNLRFGADYGLRVESRPNGPTVVRIRLPIVWTKEGEADV